MTTGAIARSYRQVQVHGLVADASFRLEESANAI